MIFKQSVLKEEKWKLAIMIFSVVFPCVLIVMLSFINRDEIKYVLTFMLFFCLPIIMLILLFGTYHLEWYCVFDDRIEVRTVYGIKNSVYFNKVSRVEEVMINLTTRGMEKAFYIFDDGRKNNNNFFNINSCYNKKRYNLRIYKTKELEEYIKNTVKIEINIGKS